MQTSDLKPYPKNPRIHGDGSKLNKSILELGDLSGVILNVRNGLLVGGHYRTKVIPKESIVETVAVKDSTGTVAEGTIVLPTGQRLNYREVDWDDTKHDLACIEANNQAIQGQWDQELLEPMLEDLQVDLPEGDFADYGLDLLVEDVGVDLDGYDNGTDAVNKSGLLEKFLVPPFSTLDTRQGYWQERKKQWLSLGIQSELGRGGDEKSASFKSQQKLSDFQNNKK